VPATSTTQLVRIFSRPLVVAAVLCATACTSVDIGGPSSSKRNPAAGVLELPGGRQIAVLPEQLNYSGEGTFTWPDGRSRSGHWFTGELNGMGNEQVDGERYSGQWRNGQRHGHGELLFADGSMYVGDFQQGLAAGRGTWTSNGSMYQGTWQAGERHGEGQYNDADGTIYQGQWHEGRRNGYGRQQYASGGVYDGDWLADQPNGFGRYVFPTGAFYEGSWVAGVRDGYGSWNSPANLSYEGTWRNDQRTGFGRESRPDGSFYAGQWLADEKHGDGREEHADGSVHIGQWQHDHILGSGERTNRTGIRISGSWRGNSITHGTLQLPARAQYEGPLFSPEGNQVAPALMQWMTAQAQQQDPHAQYFLASIYLDFESPGPDPAAAIVWMRKAAGAGLAEAQYRLAMMLMEQDQATALDWLRRAAVQHHPSANEVLGEYLHTGTFLGQDFDAAIAHYEVAADRGSVMATNNLAWLLATTGDETLADPQRAIELIQPFVLYLGNWQHLDTLAAAHARMGDTQRAQRMQRQALIQARSLASDKVLDDMAARLDLYSSNQAYIE